MVFHCFFMVFSWFFIVFLWFFMVFSKNWISKNWKSIGIHCWTSINEFIDGYPSMNSLMDHQWIHWWSINEYGPFSLGPFFGPLLWDLSFGLHGAQRKGPKKGPKGRGPDSLMDIHQWIQRWMSINEFIDGCPSMNINGFPILWKLVLWKNYENQQKTMKYNEKPWKNNEKTMKNYEKTHGF